MDLQFYITRSKGGGGGGNYWNTVPANKLYILQEHPSVVVDCKIWKSGDPSHVKTAPGGRGGGQSKPVIALN